MNEIAVCVGHRQELRIHGEVEHRTPEVVHLRPAEREHDRLRHRRDVGLGAVRAAKVRDLPLDTGRRECGVHGLFGRVGEQGGITQPPGVPQIQTGVEDERMVPDVLEKGVSVNTPAGGLTRAASHWATASAWDLPAGSGGRDVIAIAEGPTARV